MKGAGGVFVFEISLNQVLLTFPFSHVWQHYAWPLLSSAFSEVLSRTQWLRLWDHAFSQSPGFLLLLTTSLLTSSRSTLLHCTSHDDFQVS